MVNLMPVTTDNAYPGLQVMYVPLHVLQAWKSRPDAMVTKDGVEYGFVTTVTSVVFCRFYYRDRPELRTKMNSESCLDGSLFVLPDEFRRPQKEVDDFIRENYPYKMRG